MGSLSIPHIAFFPFMAKGHTMPLIHLAHLIHRRSLATLTFFTTPLNAQFIQDSLSGTNSTVVELPFPKNPVGLPPNVESTDKLPSISYFCDFVEAVKCVRPYFEKALENTPSISFVISDGFLSWTAESCERFSIPRIVFYGMGNFAWTVQNILGRERLFPMLESPEKAITIPGLPHVKLIQEDLSHPFDGPEDHTWLYDFLQESIRAMKKSNGMIVNSFYELESIYFDYWNKHIGPKAWCIGPLCLAKAKPCKRSALLEWLDSKSQVIYVAFGTQADVSEPQLKEIAIGLENSGSSFLWVVRSNKEVNLGEGFEERVSGRGLVVRDWVDQYEVLHHESVKGFLSHCGWNSVLESVCLGVPILAWPMMAEQHLNAKFVVDELRIGLRVRPSDGTKFGIVKGDDLGELVKEFMVGKRGEEFAENVRRIADKAKMALDHSGSSWNMLEEMITEVSQK